MDEKLVEQISTSSGIPQMLVSRSAQARAEASGVSTDDVLNSWTGGEAIQASPSTTAEPETEVATIEEQSPSFSEEIIEEKIEIGKSRVIKEGNKLAIINFGARLNETLKAAENLKKKLQNYGTIIYLLSFDCRDRRSWQRLYRWPCSCYCLNFACNYSGRNGLL